MAPHSTSTFRSIPSSLDIDSYSDELQEQSAPENAQPDFKDDSQSITVHRQELAATIVLAQALKELKCVGWSSFDSVGHSESKAVKLWKEVVGDSSGGDWNRAIRVWVSRQDGVIRVRKTPW
jgi:hypothetical protein